MELLKAIFGKNSLVTLVIGAILFILGAASNFTIGTFTYPTPDILGRIGLMLLGVVLIGFGLYFTYLEYKTSNVTVKGESPQTVNTQTETVVKYRDTIKLIHSKTNVNLHSHNIDYHHVGSSKQQQVTGFGGADENDYWIVKGPHSKDEFFNKGNPVKNGDIIRLEHLNTRKNLHSHPGIPAPLTAQQQEISAFSPEVNGIGNIDDNWQIEVENGGGWVTGVAIRLIHSRTKVSLHSHNIGDEEYISGQQEVTGFSKRNEDDFWLAEIVKSVR
jgi:dolichyl-phosphate-mannose--protein O-mannosyl transferase